MALVQVEVTQEDIANGERRVASRCAVARAIKRATNTQPPLWYVIGAGQRWAEFGFKGMQRHTLIALPEEVFTFTEDFDHGLQVQPFLFALDVPEELL